MPRNPSATDFAVDVDKLGRFIFARRSIGDQFKIRGRYNVLTEGFYDQDGNMADMGALAFVSIQTLLVSGPDGFDIEGLDPLLDYEFEEKIFSIWRALRDKERSFRQKKENGGEEGGAGGSENASSVVSE